MIGIFSADTTRLAVTYNGLTLNNPADAADSTYEINAVATRPLYDTIEDPSPSGDGAEVYDARKVKLLLAIDGTIRAQSYADLYDRIKRLMATFDPAKVSHENASTQGFLPLDFSVPTADTTTYPSGLVPSRYYARSASLYVPTDSEYQGLSTFFRLDLECSDPRRYLQTTSSQTGAGTIDNSKADYRSFPTITITAAGAGSATYAIQNVTAYATKSLTLNLSGLVNTDVVVVDMAAQTITKNGVATPSLYVSGSWWAIEPTNSNVITITNPTNMTTVITWRRAFCV